MTKRKDCSGAKNLLSIFRHSNFTAINLKLRRMQLVKHSFEVSEVILICKIKLIQRKKKFIDNLSNPKNACRNSKEKNKKYSKDMPIMICIA